MANASPCVDCRNLIDLSVAIEPHVYLGIYGGNISEQAHAQYYDCRICGAKLLREQKLGDNDTRWRLV